MKNPFAIPNKIIECLRPDLDNQIEKKRLARLEQNKEEISRQFYCHGCNTWQPCENDFDPYDCRNCGKSRWGD